MVRPFLRSLLRPGVLCVAGIAAAACYGQQPQQQQLPQAPPPAGMENPWEVRTIVADLTRDTTALEAIVEKLAPQQWYQKKGAPSTYILQWQNAQQQFNDVLTTNRALAQKTDNLSLALDDYFRLEALDVTLRSLEDGVRKYDERPVADKLSELIARNFNNRERFRAYIRELAAGTEQNFKIADEEAQRCRGMISKEPPARKTRR